MSDTTIIWNPALGIGDWALNGSQLQSGSDLQSAVYISLFSDRVASADDVIPDASQDPRGWWGDTGQEVVIGSRLWLLRRAKQSIDTLNLAKDYIVEALQWLIDDGVVGKFDIAVEWSAGGQLAASIMAHRPDGNTSAMQFFWNGTN